MLILLFLFHPGPANKFLLASPGKQFSLWPISTSAVMTCFQETYLQSLHPLLQYHSDRHSAQPSEKDLCPRKREDECMRERSRERGPLRPLKGELWEALNFLHSLLFRTPKPWPEDYFRNQKLLHLVIAT